MSVERPTLADACDRTATAIDLVWCAWLAVGAKAGGCDLDAAAEAIQATLIAARDRQFEVLDILDFLKTAS